MLDSLHSPTLRRDTGVDSHRIVGLLDEFPFTLQVEDPEHLWAMSPARYKQFTDTYLRLVKDRRRLMFDINVVDNRDIARSPSPTQRLSGTELAQSVLAAASASGRVGIYSEGTVAFEDLQTLAHVLGSDAQLEPAGNAWRVEAARPVLLAAPGAWHEFRVDGAPWPGWGEQQVLIPAGSHLIRAAAHERSLVDTSVLDFRLKRFVGQIESLRSTERGLQLVYDSFSRSFALFNREPFEIRIDGQVLAAVEPLAFMRHWSVRLPSGRHTVDVVADNTATIVLGTASVYSSSLIIIFGTLACAVMALLYLAVLTRRAIARRPRSRGGLDGRAQS
jgi:hypothetical protein